MQRDLTATENRAAAALHRAVRPLHGTAAAYEPLLDLVPESYPFGE